MGIEGESGQGPVPMSPGDAEADTPTRLGPVAWLTPSAARATDYALLNTSATLCPPNPKESLTAAVSSTFRLSAATSTLISGSSLFRLRVPGTTPSRIASNVAMPSTAPAAPVSYTHLRAHETVLDLVCRLLL